MLVLRQKLRPIHHLSVHVFRASRRPWAWGVGGLALGAPAVINLCVRGAWLWVVLVPLLCMGVFMLWQLISPGRLELSAATLTVHTLGIVRRYELRECGEFTVWRPRSSRREFVVFDNATLDGTRIGERNHRRSGGSAFLPDTYRMRAVDLAEILNDARRAVAPDAPAPPANNSPSSR